MMLLNNLRLLSLKNNLSFVKPMYIIVAMQQITNEWPHGKTQQSAQVKTKAQISFAVTAKLICAFVFATRIVQFLFYLNPKFLASSSFLCCRFVSDLFGNHIVGFPTRRLK